MQTEITRRALLGTAAAAGTAAILPSPGSSRRSSARPDPLAPDCALADTLHVALGAFFAVLQERTLADLIGGPDTKPAANRPGLPLPRPPDAPRP